MASLKILKGNIVHTPKFGEFEIKEKAYLVVNGAFVKEYMNSFPKNMLQ